MMDDQEQIFLKNCWYVAAWDHELIDGRKLARTILEKPVVLFRASRRGSSIGNVTIDPVCRMRIADHEWIGSLSFEGRIFRFCSMDCARRFAADPQRYADQVPATREGR